MSSSGAGRTDTSGPGRTAVLAGLGSWVPPRVVSNEELVAHLDLTDEWIRKRTGIRQRHFIDPGMATSDLAIEAGRRALESAGVDRAGAVIVATTTPDRPVPATAPLVASELGLAGVAAFDLNSACAGFVYALAVSASLVTAGTVDSVLLVCADTFSTRLNPRDRDTYPLFGDGAAAMVLRAGAPDEPGSVGPFDLGSDGGGLALATVPAGGSHRPVPSESFIEDDHYYTMQGIGLARHAVRRMVGSARVVLDRIGWQVADVDRLVCHQANLRIVTEAAHQLGIPAERCLTNIDRVANTVAASIPLALADAAAAGALQAGHRVAIATFGAGIAWGATALTWPEVKAI